MTTPRWDSQPMRVRDRYPSAISRYSFGIALLGAPLLLLVPVLHYSLTTPFSLIDDYIYDGHLRELLIFNDVERFLSYLHRNFVSSEIKRFRPLWELANGFALAAYGDNALLHHLSRWLLHFSSVAMFVSAVAIVLRPERNGIRTADHTLTHSSQSPQIAATLIPIALMVHIWVFSPNSPVSRLQPQEVHTVFFLGLCNWMAARLLVESAAVSAVRAYLTRTIFYFGCLGLACSKEVNIGMTACLLLFQLALLLRRNRPRLEIMGSILLFSITAIGAIRIYVASRNAGVGYGRRLTDVDIYDNISSIVVGLFQSETSVLIVAAFLGLGIALSFFVVRRLHQCGLDGKLVFLGLLFSEGAALFLALCLSHGVALRYWYPLVPLWAVAMAFSAYFVISAASRRSRTAARVAKSGLLVFVGFYIACNYSDFLFQTVLQHSAGTLERATVREVTRLIEGTEPVWIERTGDEHNDKLIGHFNHGGFLLDDATHLVYTERPLVYTERPHMLSYYYKVSRSAPITPGTLVWTAESRRSYAPFSIASAVATLLQGGEQHLSRDAGVMPLDGYRWNIYRLVGEMRPRLIEAEFDVYFDRRRRSLLYVKRPCAPQDAETRFYLHVVAQDEREFPAERARRRFDESFYFKFKNWGSRRQGRVDGVDGDCVAQVKLPSYAIHAISTGRVVPHMRLIRPQRYDFYERTRSAATDTRE